MNAPCPCCGKPKSECPCQFEEREIDIEHRFTWCAVHQCIVAKNEADDEEPIYTVPFLIV